MSSSKLRAKFKNGNTACKLMALFAEAVDILSPPKPRVYEIDDELGYYYGVPTTEEKRRMKGD